MRAAPATLSGILFKRAGNFHSGVAPDQPALLDKYVAPTRFTAAAATPVTRWNSADDILPLRVLRDAFYKMDSARSWAPRFAIRQSTTSRRVLVARTR